MKMMFGVMKRLGRFFLSVSMILILVSFVLAPSLVEARGKPAAIYGKGDSTLVVATGSPGALGLVKALSAPSPGSQGGKTANVLWGQTGIRPW